MLAALIEQRLAAHGFTAQAPRRARLGRDLQRARRRATSTPMSIIPARIWANEMHRTDVQPRAGRARRSGALAATRPTASACSARSVSRTPMRWPCRARCRKSSACIRSPIWPRTRRELSIAGDYEFFERPEWKAIRDAYGLHFRAQRTMQSDFMYQAAAAGDVDVVSAYTSDGRIEQFDLVVLDDPKHAIPPYDAVLLLSPKRAHDEALIAALKPLIGAIPVELMREANLRASSGKASAAEVARWLADKFQENAALVLLRSCLQARARGFSSNPSCSSRPRCARWCLRQGHNRGNWRRDIGSIAAAPRAIARAVSARQSLSAS